MQLDVSKKLLRGKKIAIEGGEERWIAFKYERFPNFCYRCGLLSHGMRDCLEGRGEVPSKQPVLQYRAWLRSEVPRRGGGDVVKFGIEDGWYGKGGRRGM